MDVKEEVNKTLDKMILSASGWRGVFAIDGNEESKTEKISAAHKVICRAAALAFSGYLSGKGEKPVILLGTDTRPTGKAVANAMIPVLRENCREVRYAGVVAAPEIMAWARTFSALNAGFIYISASHNPIGHNGIKFGLTDGGVLSALEMEKLITDFKAEVKKINYAEEEINREENEEYPVEFKSEAYKAYFDFCAFCAVKSNIGIVADFNGSARAASIDKEFFTSCGIKFDSINNKPGVIAHRIVPEGDSLEPCARFLEQIRKRDPSFVLGYVPDCDGDRGNLVIWDDALNKARALEAQEVFALAVYAQLSCMDISSFNKEAIPKGNCQADECPLLINTLQLADRRKACGIVVNDPTSMRVDAICESFGVNVFRAEVGEANIVNLARRLREQGYTVPILGEGSAGGVIVHPSVVRDPLQTIMLLVKLLVAQSNATLPANRFPLPKKNGKNFTLADIISKLPKYTTTGSYSDDAIMRVKTTDHALLKERYQKVFEREWEERKEELKTRRIFGWEAVAYNGTREARGIKNFGDAKKGGLKILFFDKEGNPVAFIWMRGSATEPVFRVMADVEGTDKELERLLINWQRSMIEEADKE